MKLKVKWHEVAMNKGRPRCFETFVDIGDAALDIHAIYGRIKEWRKAECFNFVWKELPEWAGYLKGEDDSKASKYVANYRERVEAHQEGQVRLAGWKLPKGEPEELVNDE